jgi:transposase
MVNTRPLIIGGVDTHADTHTVAALNSLGQLLGHATFPASRAGYRALLGWLDGHGQVDRVGVEGTGSYGAGLARHLSSQGAVVVEVDRPNRQQRRRHGKSDPADAVAAARAVLAGTATATPKSRTGVAESLRVLRATQRSAEKARTAALNSLRHMVIAAPEDLREPLDGLKGKALISACAALRPDPGQLHDPHHATKISLRRLARRASALSAELTEVKADIKTLVTQAAPELLRTSASDRTPPPSCWSPPATTLTGSTTTPPSPPCAGSARSRHPPAAPTGTGSTAAATGRPTPPCGGSSWSGCATTNPPATTSPAAPLKA